MNEMNASIREYNVLFHSINTFSLLEISEQLDEQNSSRRQNLTELNSFAHKEIIISEVFEGAGRNALFAMIR